MKNILGKFNHLNSSGNIGEVALFRNMAIAIAAHSNSVYIEETHGASKANVEFSSPRSVRDRCEIADQLIVSISMSNHLARATFIQAKFTKQPKWADLLIQSQMDFRAQSNQWFLLHSRPVIRGINRFNPPSDLLSGSQNPAIGSYGVYYRSHGVYEMSYSIGALVSCASPTVAHPKLAINGTLNDVYYGESVAVATTISGFLEHLIGFRVGAFVSSSNSVGSWLLNYVKAKALAASVGDEIIAAIDSVALDEHLHADLPESKGDGISILIVVAP